MTESRAHEIVAVCLAHFLYQEGLNEKELPSLGDYSLKEMLEANEIVKSLNDGPSVGGLRTVYVHCDPRYLAALYVAYHYDPDPVTSCTPIAFGPKSALLVVERK